MVTATPAATATAGLAELLGSPQRIGVAYRPVVDLRAGIVRGYAAEARLPVPGAARGWFAEAAAAGAAGVLEAQVVQAALVVRPLLAQGRPVRVALSAQALLSEPVWAVLAAEPALDHLVVELDGAEDPCAALPTAVAELRARGARIAVDLTSCGLPGLACVRTLDPLSVVADAARPDALGALLAGIAELALEHEPRVVVRGIETDAHLDAVVRRGIRFGEGPALGAAQTMPGEIDRAVRSRLLERTPHLDLGGLAVPGPGCGPGVLRLPAATSPRDAARRAMARPAAVRFDPIAVVAADGSDAGLVPIERLVSALAA